MSARHHRIALVLVVLACAPKQAQIPILGTPAAVAGLLGEWVGEYSSTATGRSGSISFHLEARGDSAHGDVVMIPIGWGRPLRPWTDGAVAADTPHPPEALTISFVRVEGDQVAGSLEPYADPETGVRLVTRFEGQLRADTVAGTFTTRMGESAMTQGGNWRVVRRRSS